MPVPNTCPLTIYRMYITINRNLTRLRGALSEQEHLSCLTTRTNPLIFAQAIHVAFTQKVSINNLPEVVRFVVARFVLIFRTSQWIFPLVSIVFAREHLYH